MQLQGIVSAISWSINLICLYVFILIYLNNNNKDPLSVVSICVYIDILKKKNNNNDPLSIALPIAAAL